MFDTFRSCVVASQSLTGAINIALLTELKNLRLYDVAEMAFRVRYGHASTGSTLMRLASTVPQKD